MDRYVPAHAAQQVDEYIERVRRYINIRWFYLASLTLISTLSLVLARGFDNEAQRNLSIGVSALIYNAALFGMARVRTRSRVYFGVIAFLEIFFDLSLATYLITVRGGIEARSIILYAIPIIVAGAIFGRLAIYLSAAASAILYGYVLIMIHLGHITATNVGISLFPNSADYVAYSIAFYSAVFIVLALVADILFSLARSHEAVKAQIGLINLASHELLTPMTATRGLIEMVLTDSKELKKESRHFLEQAYLESDRELSLIDNLLAVARFDAKQYKVSTDEVDIAEIVRTAADRMQPFINSSSQKLEFDLPDVRMIPGNPELLTLAVVNLLSNASRFSKDGAKIRVSLQVDQDVQLHVIDEGRGISKHDVGRIFERFTKLSGVNEGAGLGLFVAKQIAEFHGGTLSVSSKAGSGSDFALQLPYKRDKKA